MPVGEELRKRRLERGWRLQDVAVALGVTSATVSRVERGLQEPSPELLEAWQQLLTGQRWLPLTPKSPRRRPHGILSLLAELFLADVKAGLDETEAGWRELAEVGLAAWDVKTLGPEVERDHLGRVRIDPKISMEPVVQAQKILRYRATVEAEQKALLPSLEERLPALWQALGQEDTCGAVLVSGLATMVRAGAPFLDAYPTLLGGDAGHLISGAVGSAHVILEGVGIMAPSPSRGLLEAVGLNDLIEPVEEGAIVLQARDLAQYLGLPTMAGLLGKTGVTAVGAAWAVVRRLESGKGVILTEVGRQRVAEAFWEGIQLSRPEVEAAWRRLVEFDPQTYEEQVGVLLWSWPEVF